MRVTPSCASVRLLVTSRGEQLVPSVLLAWMQWWWPLMRINCQLTRRDAQTVLHLTCSAAWYRSTFSCGTSNVVLVKYIKTNKLLLKAQWKQFTLMTIFNIIIKDTSSLYPRTACLLLKRKRANPDNIWKAKAKHVNIVYLCSILRISVLKLMCLRFVIVLSLWFFSFSTVKCHGVS